VAAEHDAIERRGDFVWGKDGRVTVRSRAGTEIPIERVAPEEIREAVLLVMRTGGVRERKALIQEVRTLLGLDRGGAKLQEAVGAAIDDLLASGVLGEGSSGIQLRQ